MRKKYRAGCIMPLVASVAPTPADAVTFTLHLEELFDGLDPQKISPAYAKALEDEDYEKAIAECAAYYRNKPDCPVPEFKADTPYDKDYADRSIAGHVQVINVDWDYPDGRIQYLFDATMVNGPRNHEWTWQLNRHYFWPNMACAYKQTGDEKYAVAFNQQMLDWIAQTYIPEEWNAPGSAWRTIECGLRLLGSWETAFENFRRSPSVSDVALLLMIASMHRQAKHLQKHPTRANWLMMESNGIYAFASLFTEYTDAAELRDIAAQWLLRELKGQVLPDGMHNELSPDYQSVVYGCAMNFYSLARVFGRENELPEEFLPLIEKNIHAAVLLSTPNFTQPRTNDCYTILTTVFTARAERTLPANPEYTFVNSRRAAGAPPQGKTASAYLPYAGLAAMRSDWGEDAAYLCFDVGPLGMAHWHQDKLNINIYKGKDELIFDDGGGQYEISPAREYALSSYGHNTVLVDGLGQNRVGPAQSTEPIDAGWVTNDTFDYAYGTYDEGYGKDRALLAKQKREVRFCKPGFFCVKDTMTSVDGNAHSYELLLQLDTTKVEEAKEYPGAILSDFGRKYDVLIVPVDAEQEEAPTAVSAQTEPMRGWYVGRNENKLHEAITVARKISDVKDHRFVTLFFPIIRGQALPEITKDGQTLHVTFEGNAYTLDLNELSQ